MRHEDGYCDSCGCEAFCAQLTVDGRAICEACLSKEHEPVVTLAKRPEARDDGR